MSLPCPALQLAFRHAIVHTRWRGSYATCIMDEDDGYHLWMGPTVNNRLRILGWLYVALGGVGLLAGSVLGLAFLLSPEVQSHALQVIGPLFLMIAAGLLIPAMLGGIGLLYAQPWARILIIILSALFVPV